MADAAENRSGTAPASVTGTLGGPVDRARRDTGRGATQSGGTTGHGDGGVSPHPPGQAEQSHKDLQEMGPRRKEPGPVINAHLTVPGRR